MAGNLAPETSNHLLGGRYRLGPVIGRGGMGAVYRGVDQILDREVAVKVLYRDGAGSEVLWRQQREIATLARLNHPGLAALYDAGSSPREGGTLSWLVMELIPGPDLGRYLEAGPLALAEMARVGAALGETLNYIHRCKVVHRDVKPGNIMMARYAGDEEPRPKLADFGIAKLIDGPQLTRPDASLGTAAYLSPEQVAGEDIGPASDVYSLGLVLLQCLTGTVEYPGSPLESALARTARPPRIPPNLDPQMAGLLAAMTALEPGDRPDAGELAHTLHRICGRDELPAGSGRTVPDASVAAPLPATRVLPRPTPGPHPVLPVLQTNQLTNVPSGPAWPVLPEKPAWPPSSTGGPAGPAAGSWPATESWPAPGFWPAAGSWPEAGSWPARRRRGPRLVRMAVLAAFLLIVVAAARSPAAALLRPATSGPGPSPAPTVPALLQEHLRQLEESVAP
jgi:serine/threonine protein kinase